jgi:hypothetical protein
MITPVAPKKSRARKTSLLPTRIYSYRCLPPLTEVQRVEDQFRLAHQYRNAHVEIELRLRGRLRDVQLAIPEVAAAVIAYEEVCADVESTFDDLREAKSGTATPDLADLRVRLDAAEEWRAECFTALCAVKRTCHEALTPGYKTARALAAAERIATRTDYSARGLRHGAYDRIEKAIQQATGSTKRPLTFERYEGEGSIGTQLTARGCGGGAMGMTVRELHSCQDTRLRLEPLPDDYNQMPRNRRRHAARVHAWLRVGTEVQGRAPIFAQFPVTFHRPLPKDAVIKWAYVVRKRIGRRYEWRLQLTIESATFHSPTQAVGEGACAIDLGWRRIFDDEQHQIGLRAGFLVDEQGAEREILVPEKLWRGMSKVYDLGKIRDQNLERAQFQLSDYLVDRSLPVWMAERLRGYSAWRAPRKLQALIDRWQREIAAPTPADPQTAPDIAPPPLPDFLLAWAKQDRHLHHWQEHQRDRLIAHRRETWKVLAAEIARTYAVVLVEDGINVAGTMKLTDLPGWERPSPEDGDPSDDREQHRCSRLAAVGELRSAIEKACGKTGARAAVSRAQNSTTECAECGYVQKAMNARVSITHACEGCGVTWDQDANAAKNLLQRHLASAPVPPAVPEVLAPLKKTKPQAYSGSSMHAHLNKKK